MADQLNFIRVRGAEYPVVRVQFMPHTTTA